MCGSKIDIVQQLYARSYHIRHVVRSYHIRHVVRSYHTAKIDQIILYKGFNVGEKEEKGNEAVRCICVVK